MCLLDPKASEVLTPADAAAFDLYVFGGILGDDPPKYRTGELHPLRAAARHLGPVQMTTDTAVLVTHAIVVHGRPLEALTFVDRPDVVLGVHESVNLPFRYLAAVDGSGAPDLPRGMREHLRDSMDEPL
jgi:ribosome biogenesis SPOUT family RNA methylase Rps3